jgi:hypothetical protein
MKIPPFSRFLLFSFVVPLLAFFASVLAAQTLVPSTTTLDAANRVKVSFATTAGKNYRVEHTTDFLTWTFYPGSIYGLGQTADYYVYEGDPPPSAPAPPASGPAASEFYMFFVTAFSDGAAVASWSGASGQSCQAYLSAFDMRNAGVVLNGVVSPTVTPASPAVPYNLTVFVSTGTKLAAYTSLTAPTGETTTLQKLSSQATTVRNALINQAANPTQPLPPRLFDDRGQPLHQFFCVRSYEVDSNYDGIADHVQLASGTPSAAYTQDNDGDGIPNGYDRDLVPQATDPARYALLSNVLINEVLISNDFTNADEDSQSNDWVELYNPTNAPIDLSGWYLSDSRGNKTKWQIPAGVSIGNGQFLVIWASSKNRINPANPLHTSYSFGAGSFTPFEYPEPVYLSRPDTATVDAFDYQSPNATPVYGPQRPDVSFGRFPSVTSYEDKNGNGLLDPKEDQNNNGVLDAGEDTDGDGVLDPAEDLNANSVLDVGSARLVTGYMILPTPGTQVASGKFSGAHNIVGALGFCAPPIFSGSNPGIYTDTSTPGEPGDPEGGDPGLPASPPTITVSLSAAADAAIHLTTNGTNPSRYSELYSGTMGANRTLVVRAIAAKEGWLPSTSVTRSFLFKEDILGTSPEGTTPTNQQGARDASNKLTGLLQGYPETSEVNGYPLRYEMHPNVVRDKKNTLLMELDAVPVISIVGPVADLFQLESGGIYPNSGKTDNYWAGRAGPDPRSRDWERACSFEFIKADKSSFVQSNAGLSMTGGSSLYQDVTRKHNMRIQFDATYGLDKLQYQLFTDFAGDSFKTIHVKNPTHDAWSQTNFGQYQQASYCDEGWIRSAQRVMGHENPRRRWVHLFLNGIYWGPYELTERVDSDYIRGHAGALGDATYDVLKQRSSSDPPNANEVAAIDGTTTAWDNLITLCSSFGAAVSGNQPLAAQDSLYSQILGAMDVDNYIDYLLCYAYAQGYDWPTNNFRIARSNNLSDNRFRFYVWDAEWALQPEEYNQNAASRISVASHVTRPHSILRNYSAYKQKFAERLRYHFHLQPGVNGSGALADTASGDRAVQLFQSEMAKFQPVLYSESARWGYLQKAVPYTYSDLNVAPGVNTKGDWLRTTTHLVQTWLPQRRKLAFGHFAGQNLYVAITPVDLPNPKVGTAYSQTLTVTGGTAPRTLALAYGTLPPGISLSVSTLTGTPTTTGIYTFTLSATTSDTVQGTSRPLTGLTRFTLTVTP